MNTFIRSLPGAISLLMRKTVDCAMVRWRWRDRVLKMTRQRIPSSSLLHYRIIAITRSQCRYHTIAIALSLSYHLNVLTLDVPSHHCHRIILIALSHHRFIVITLSQYRTIDANVDGTMMQLWTTWPYPDSITKICFKNF